MDKRARYEAIARLQGSEAWKAVEEELDELEATTIKRLKFDPHCTKEEIAAMLIMVDKFKELPSFARQILEKE